MDIIWRVLPRAIDAEDWVVIEACRRLIVANRLGWRRYTNAADWNLVMAFDDLPSPSDDPVEPFDEQHCKCHHPESVE
jgi:hypothetical protein